MVSQVASEKSKSPPLSYADRAKQARKGPASNVVQPVQRTPQPQKGPSPNGSSTGPPPADPRPIDSVEPQSPNNQPTMSDSLAPKYPLRQQTDAKIEHEDSPAPIPQSSAQKSTAPPVNVWNIRKEQMARALSQPQPISTASNIPPPSETQVSSASFINPTAEPKQDDSRQSNGFTAPAVQPSTQEVAEDWPAVGSTVSHQLSHRSPGDGTGGVATSSESSRTEPPVIGPKKGEKQKWIVIPPEELQAAADAQRQQNRVQYHGRARQQLGGQVSASTGSASGSSRTHSAAGVRQAGSQSHSRAGSVHSSPRQSSGRGGKRLPDERPSETANRSARSSRATSPQRQRRFQSTQTSATLAEGERSQLSFSGNQEPAFVEPIPGYPYYPPLPPSTGGTRTHSYQSTHAMNSPTSHPYGLPYTGSSPAYAGPSPYAVYPPYPYPYAPPYMPWAPGHEPPPHFYASGHVAPPGPIPHAHPLGDPTSHDMAVGIPPPTMVARPPPPEHSDAVAGYRDIDFVLPAPATYENQEQKESEDKEERRRQISFGSISLTSSQSPPQSPSSPVVANGEKSSSLGLDINGIKADSPTERSGEGSLGIEKQFTAFTIGVSPGDVGPSRSTSGITSHSLSAAPSRDRMETAPAALSSEAVKISTESSASPPAEGHKVIDLTEPQTKWAFGTVSSLGEVHTLAQSVQPSGTEEHEGPTEIPSATQNGVSIGLPAPPRNVRAPSFVEPPHQQPIPVQSHTGYPPPMVAPIAVSPTSSASPYPPNAVSPIVTQSSDDFQVRNFGYGFGRGVAPGVPPSGPPPSMEEQRDMPLRDYQPPPHGGRPRRGSYGGEFRYERGGHSMRRGRGGYGGRGSGRGYSRGGGGSNFQQNQQQKAPFTVVPPPISPISDPAGYYPPVPQPQISGTTYFHPAAVAYDPYYAPYGQPLPPPHLMVPPAPAPPGPPLPSPITRTSYPLDPLRHRLLGQLEYYLSTQNLAKDFFLRQRMDSRGWISVSLIASFNRVKQLTADVRLVLEVLSLSSLAEVKDNHVRIHEWQRYVLPGASKSVVEEDIVQPIGTNTPEGPATLQSTNIHEAYSHHEIGAEDEEDAETEEDDVEFVLGKDANRSEWTPERTASTG